MKNCIILFVFIISCSNNVDSSGFKFIINCSIADKTIEILEEEISFVDWENQEYHLTTGKLKAADFNNDVCFGGCLLKAYLNNIEIYEATLYCEIAPNNVSNNKRPNIFIRPAGEFTLMDKNVLRLNLSSRRTVSQDKKKQAKISDFLYNAKLKKYFIKQELIK